MTDVVGPIGFIRQMVNEGMSATKGLDLYRSAGGRIQTQRWYRAFSTMKAEAARRPTIQTAPIGRAPAGEEITQVESRRPGAYLYRGAVVAFDRETNLPVTKYASLRTRKLITYRQAIDILAGQMEAEQDSYGVTVVGAYVTAVNELVPVQPIAGVFDA